jgi:glucose/arabinose dehydrogenase/mono/diheme cytochrome c family protein
LHGWAKSRRSRAEGGRSIRAKIVDVTTRVRIAFVLIVLLAPLVVGSTQQPAGTGAQRPAKPKPAPQAARFAAWVEPDSPFFSSVLDAGHAAAGFPTINLTPRGLVLNLGRGCWATFDTDLLRVAAIWRGNGVTPKALAPGSYHDPDRKTPGGQFPAPEPDGKLWLANGIYPGWQIGTHPSFEDPREPAPSPEEVGRGPLSEEMGRFKAVRLVKGGAVLEYTVGGTDVREWVTVAMHNRQPVIERHLHVGPSSRPFVLMLGYKEKGVKVSVSEGGVLETVLVAADRVGFVRVPAHREAVAFSVAFAEGGDRPPVTARPIPVDIPAPRWRQQVTTKVKLSTAKAAYVVDEVALPLNNAWRRDVRISDIQFLEDGTGVGVTLDGDVWLIRGLNEPGGGVRWQRFASGLHEPLTLAIRDGQIYVFDRNGIWRLRDTNGDEEADVHEMFSNVFAQTADMREFPSTLRLGPGGEFVIAKGNQEATTLGKHNGRVLRISADGRRFKVLGYGFRQPNIGVNVRTGLVTASDQQGHYIPSTPLHIVRDGRFYGFLSTKQPREVYPEPIADPLTWIPHTVNASAISQVWLFGARMGPLNDALIHIGFNRPELFRVLMNERTSKPQAAVVSITRDFSFPPLNGSVNPADGQMYVAGFQILGWGTTAGGIAGLGRLRYTGATSTLPRDVVPMDKGVLLRFDTALDPATAADPNNYALESWHYQRSYKYGSPQLKADGTPGTDWLGASRAYLSKDRHGVFVAVPGMKPVMQMRIGWSLKTATGAPFAENAYFTPYELAEFDPVKEGFGDVKIDLSPRMTSKKAAAPISAEQGRQLFDVKGCIACHSIEATKVATLGPSLKGLYGKQRPFAKAGRVIADDAYLRESILEPMVKIVPGFEKGEAGMPSYAGVLTPRQIESIILYIKSLQ